MKEPHAVLAYVALGSNLGDSLATFEEACAELDQVEGIAVGGRSQNHRTRPVGGPPDQPDYWNGVIQLRTSLTPEVLLQELQAVERRHGRNRATEIRFGPRTLDLDLLLHGDERREGECLELPHPRMEERRFVLEPLADLDPELRLPGCGKTVRERLLELPANHSKNSVDGSKDEWRQA